MKKYSYSLIIAGLLSSSVQAGELVVIVNSSAAAPTQEQVADIYLGKSQAFNPVDLPESSPVYADFYKKATGRDVAQVKATWSRIIFTGKGQAPKSLADSAAVKKAVAADPKAIGYIEKSALDSSVKAAVTLD